MYLKEQVTRRTTCCVATSSKTFKGNVLVWLRLLVLVFLQLRDTSTVLFEVDPAGNNNLPHAFAN